MRRFLFLLILILWLAGCAGSGGSDDESGATVPSERATVAAGVDGGEPPVLDYQRAGDNAGDVLEWRIYADGRVAAITTPAGETPEVVETDVEPQKVTRLVQDLEKAGFIDAAQPGEVACCDPYKYVLTMRQNDTVNTIAVERVTPEIAAARLQSINFVEKFIFEELTNASGKE